MPMTTASADLRRIEIDGVSAAAEQLGTIALSGFGHFTAMQVRGRRVRGMRYHIARLESASHELFGVGIDEQLLRGWISHALADDVTDASVRVYVHEGAQEPATMVTVRSPGVMLASPWRLRSVPYQRPVAHIKHIADFGQRYYQRLAHATGFDEALLTGPDGIISEGSITNIGCFDGTTVIWPAAPALAGITMQLLESALAAAGLQSARAHVRISDLSSFAGVFVTNARGIAPVGQVDDVTLPVNQQLMDRIAASYESVPWDSV
jgi:branched-subunit amino acid aminotransferase/4-amino-4-deoxychorismate lyase